MNDIILTEKQKEAVELCVTRYKAHKAYTCIAGYAGVGKSTCIKFITQALGLKDEEISYIAYTGKAALVLREKGCPNAMTAHKLLYKAFRNKDGTYSYVPKAELDGPYKVIIVDEVSMLDEAIWKLLLSHHVYVIALGDPAQLPPVRGSNGVLDHPHIFLDQIMRQAQESEIIRLSMDIRNGKSLSLYSGKEVQIIDKSQMVSGMLLWADQIIVAKNGTRQFYNNLMRDYLFGADHPDGPVEGDKIIALHNDYKCLDTLGEPLVNGAIGTISNICYKTNNTKNHSKKYIPHNIIPEFMYADFIPDYGTEGEKFIQVNMDKKLFDTGEPTVTRENFRKIPGSMQPHEFDYGYVITAWKAQGSEYDKVLVLEEDFPWNFETHKKYLYTCITRAIKKLVIVRQ